MQNTTQYICALWYIDLIQVVDSPFTSLIKMCQDVAREHYSIPKVLINLGLGIINGSIKSRINVDLFEDLVPIDSSKSCSVRSAKKDSRCFHHWRQGRPCDHEASTAIHDRLRQ